MRTASRLGGGKSASVELAVLAALADLERNGAKSMLALYLAAAVADAREERHHAERLAAAESGADLRDVSQSAIIGAAPRTYLGLEPES